MANYQKTYENTWNELTNKEKKFYREPFYNKIILQTKIKCDG